MKKCLSILKIILILIVPFAWILLIPTLIIKIKEYKKIWDI